MIDLIIGISLTQLFPTLITTNKMVKSLASEQAIGIEEDIEKRAFSLSSLRTMQGMQRITTHKRSNTDCACMDSNRNGIVKIFMI